MKALSTPEEVAEAKHDYLVALMECGGRISHSCMSAGVRIDQVKKWRASDPDFYTLEEQCKLFHDDELRKKIDEKITEDNERVLLAAMKRLPEYQPNSHSTVTHQGEVTHRAVIANMDNSEKDELIREAHGLIVDAEYEDVEKD